jgi:hypothetical protein
MRRNTEARCQCHSAKNGNQQKHSHECGVRHQQIWLTRSRPPGCSSGIRTVAISDREPVDTRHFSRYVRNGFLLLTLTGRIRHYGYVKSYLMHGNGFWRQDEWPGSPIVGLPRFFVFSLLVFVLLLCH